MDSIIFPVFEGSYKTGTAFLSTAKNLFGSGGILRLQEYRIIRLKFISFSGMIRTPL